MKTFIAAWLITAILGWFLLFIFGAILGQGGTLALGITLIALLITMLISLFNEIETLTKRVDQLEADASKKAENNV